MFIYVARRYCMFVAVPIWLPTVARSEFAKTQTSEPQHAHYHIPHRGSRQCRLCTDANPQTEYDSAVFLPFQFQHQYVSKGFELASARGNRRHW